MKKEKPRLLIFASGTKDGGGSGARKLIEAAREGKLNAEIIGLISNHKEGGVKKIAAENGIPFFYAPASAWTAEKYQEIADFFQADFFALSGWMIKIAGLDLKTRFSPRTVFNIHPGLLPRFGGKGMYGHFVHEATWAAYQKGEIKESAVTMHFVDDQFDHGPVFFELRIEIMGCSNPEELGKKVNVYEHAYQWHITNLVVNGKISWDGTDPRSLSLPPDYSKISFAP